MRTEDASSPQDAVLRMMMGAWTAQITFVLAEYAVPDLLADGAQSPVSVAAKAGTDPDATLRLLRAAATVGLLSEVDGDYELTELGRCLRADVPGSMREQALAYGSAASWRLCGELRRSVRTGESAAQGVLGGTLWDHHVAHPAEGEHFSRAMGEQSARVAAEVADAVDPSGYGRIADLGGAHGDLLRALLDRAPLATGMLVDLPPVIEAARARIAEPRIELCPGDFFQEVPEADLYLLKWILHDWDDDAAIRILSVCRRSAPAQARLLVIEMLVPAPWQPSPVHLFDLAMLVMLGSPERTEDQYAALLAEAGWRLERVIPTSGAFHILQATAA